MMQCYNLYVIYNVDQSGLNGVHCDANWFPLITVIQSILCAKFVHFFVHFILFVCMVFVLQPLITVHVQHAYYVN